MPVLSRVQKLFPVPRIMSFSSVGVDVSDTSLKYIQFDRVHAHDVNLVTKYWGDLTMPNGIVERGNVHDVTKLSAVLNEMREKTNAQYVNMSLPEERAYLFETTLPIDTPRKEIRGLLDFRLEENVPLSPRDAYFDYVIVGSDVKLRILHIVVSVYAQSTINSYYDACVQARLTPLSFEIEAQAIARASIPAQQAGTYMVVDFGKTRMGVGIVNNGILRYTSTIEIAGEQISADMRAVLGDVPESELTHIKNIKGLSHTKDNEHIASILRGYAETIVEELGIRIHYWDTRDIDSEARTIKKVIICGGSANLFGLPEFLSQKLEIPTERAQVWANVLSLENQIPEITRRYSYGYGTAIGLALRGFI